MTDVSSDPKSDVVSSLDDDSLGSAAPIKLVSKDGKEFLLDRKYAFISNLIKTSLENDPSATEVPMPGVKADVLAKVVEFMAHHKGVQPPIIEKPLKSKLMKELCKDPWDADYIDKIGEERQALFDLVLAANYMDITGQPLEKIRDILSTSVGKSK